MDTLSSVLDGLAVVAEPANLLYVVIGVVVGMIVGVLPGLGPSATIALLLPLTYNAPAEGAIIMLAGVYYGAYYGGTVTSVLLRLPGEAASVVTTFDGYQMARKGRAGAALGISAIGSFVGGLVAVIGMILLAPKLADLALEFGPPEYVALAMFGLLMAVFLGNQSILKSIVVTCLGLLVATVGLDTVTGAQRFTFGSPSVMMGIDFVAVVMGLFGVGEILYNLEQEGRARRSTTSKVGRVWPTKKERRESAGAIGRGSVLGFLLGLLPGGGGVIASLASYSTERKISKNPEEFGHGSIQGVAGPETANNAGSTSAFVPLLTLGIPSNAVLALLFGALLIQGVTPGPQLVSTHPDIFWGVITSMIVGNLILLLLALPLVRFFILLVRVRLGILASVIAVLTMAAVYSVNFGVFDMWMMLAFGVLGYLMRKTGFESGPLVLAVVLGPLLEEGFRQSMRISHGSLSIFLDRPVPLAILIVTAGVILRAVYKSAIARRSNADNAASEDKTLV